MEPNIDRNGRVARAISGLVCIVIGILVAVFALEDAPVWRWSVSILLILFGLFQLFEAQKCWCVMRAMGFKTPM